MLAHLAVSGALQLGEGLIGRGVAAQSASRTPGWNRPRVRHIWVEPNAVLPPSGENSEHIRALQMIFAAESQLNHALVGSLEYISGGKPWNTHGIAKINSLTSRKKKVKE